MRFPTKAIYITHVPWILYRSLVNVNVQRFGPFSGKNSLFLKLTMDKLSLEKIIAGLLLNARGQRGEIKRPGVSWKINGIHLILSFKLFPKLLLELLTKLKNLE